MNVEVAEWSRDVSSGKGVSWDERGEGTRTRTFDSDELDGDDAETEACVCAGLCVRRRTQTLRRRALDSIWCFRSSLHSPLLLCLCLFLERERVRVWAWVEDRLAEVVVVARVGARRLARRGAARERLDRCCCPHAWGFEAGAGAVVDARAITR